MTNNMMLISGIKAIRMALMTICKPEKDKMMLLTKILLRKSS